MDFGGEIVVSNGIPHSAFSSPCRKVFFAEDYFGCLGPATFWAVWVREKRSRKHWMG